MEPAKRTPPATSLVRTVLAVCLLYQVGACPCGCLDHNLWALTLGLASGESPVASEAATTYTVAAEEHDCHGEASSVYVNTARTIKVPGITLCSTQAISATPILHLARVDASRHLLSPDCSPLEQMDATGRQSRLQIFLL